MSKEKLFNSVNYAISNIPYYIRGKYNNIDSCEKFEKLPIIRKNDIIDNIKDYMCVDVPASEDILVKQTSGSLGIPFMVYIDRQSELESSIPAIMFRKKYYGILSNMKFCYFYSNVYTHGILQEDSKFIYRKNSLGINKKYIRNEYILEIIDQIKQFEPVWIIAQPSIMLILAHYIHEYKIEFSNIQYMELTGEKLTCGSKTYLQDVFKCKIADMYSMTEFNCIAFENIEKQYEILQDNVYVEVINESGKVVYDEEGRIIVTSLNNRIMPLIRYDTGDRGSLSQVDDKLLLTLSTGRSIKNIQINNGEYISPYVFYSIINEINDLFLNCVIQYQLAQVSYSEFNYRLVLNPKYEGWKKVITENILELTKRDISQELIFNVIFEPYIELSDNQKSNMLNYLK